MRRTATFLIVIVLFFSGILMSADAAVSTGYTITLPENRKGIVGETVLIPVVIRSFLTQTSIWTAQ